MLRFFCWALMLAGVLAAPAARAQPDDTPYVPLPIAVPPNAKVQMELDAHDHDLLGSVKSFLKGMNPGATMGMMTALGAAMPRLGGMPAMPPPRGRSTAPPARPPD